MKEVKNWQAKPFDIIFFSFSITFTTCTAYECLLKAFKSKVSVEKRLDSVLSLYLNISVSRTGMLQRQPQAIASRTYAFPLVAQVSEEFL